MKILLTGHHGYIGSVAGPLLHAAGHEVTGLDTFFYEGCDLRDEADRVPALRLDLRDADPEALVGHDAIVHLAALSNDPLGDISPELTREVNFEATSRLARAAKEAGVRRFVFSSSCSMYGASEPHRPVDETAPLAPLTAYAESKVLSEKALADLADETFTPVFMRNATAYGVSPRLRVDLVLNNLVGWAFTTGKVKIMSDGTPWRPLIHVEDIARATLAVLEAPREAVRGEAFNVGRAEENYQVRDLAEIVRETVGDCEIEYAGSGDPDPRSYRVDFTKFAQAFPEAGLSWTARGGAREVLNAYREVGLTLEEFEGDRYIRLKHLRLLLDRGELDSQLRWRAARVR
ncbi:MAG: NAD-dependent epimerase/dehydratase family protein [Gaiellaceae bacterium]